MLPALLYCPSFGLLSIQRSAYRSRDNQDGKFKGSTRQEEKAKLLQKQTANNHIVDDFIKHNIDGFEKKFIMFIACGDSSSARDRYKHFQFLKSGCQGKQKSVEIW